jgi:hypothetical protein
MDLSCVEFIQAAHKIASVVEIRVKVLIYLDNLIIFVTTTSRSIANVLQTYLSCVMYHNFMNEVKDSAQIWVLLFRSSTYAVDCHA